jgi:thioredoxin-dependent peroxiredoxin
MKHWIWGMVLAAAFAATASAALKQGDKAPIFTAKASLAGKDFTFSLRKALAKGPVVLYFYPSAFTRGCDLEAHTFSENKDKFDAAGATIIGVSADSLMRLNDFSADPNYCAGQFPVASDSNLKVATSYGVKASPTRPGAKDVRGVAIDHPFIARTTFVIGKNGRIVAEFSSEADHLSPDEHVTKALSIVQQLAAK